MRLVQRARDLLWRAAKAEAPMVRQTLILEADEHLAAAEGGLRKTAG